MIATSANRGYVSRTLMLGLLHFGFSVAGLVVFGVVEGLAGRAEPFWDFRGKGPLLMILGVQMLAFASLLFALVIKWSTRALPSSRTQFVALSVSAFVGGVALVYIFSTVARIGMLFVTDSSHSQDSLIGVISLLASPVVCAVLTAVLTRLGIEIGQRWSGS